MEGGESEDGETPYLIEVSEGSVIKGSMVRGSGHVGIYSDTRASCASAGDCQWSSFDNVAAFETHNWAINGLTAHNEVVQPVNCGTNVTCTQDTTAGEFQEGTGSLKTVIGAGFTSPGIVFSWNTAFYQSGGGPTSFPNCTVGAWSIAGNVATVNLTACGVAFSNTPSTLQENSNTVGASSSTNIVYLTGTGGIDGIWQLASVTGSTTSFTFATSLAGSGSGGSAYQTAATSVHYFPRRLLWYGGPTAAAAVVQGTFAFCGWVVPNPTAATPPDTCVPLPYLPSNAASPSWVHVQTYDPQFGIRGTGDYSYGIYCLAASGCPSITVLWDDAKTGVFQNSGLNITANNIVRSHYAAIMIEGGNNCLIANNTIQDPGWGSDYGVGAASGSTVPQARGTGVLFDAGITSESVTNCTVGRNTFFSSQSLQNANMGIAAVKVNDGSRAITNLSESGNIVTVTSILNPAIGSNIRLAGNVPAGYNTSFTNPCIVASTAAGSFTCFNTTSGLGAFSSGGTSSYALGLRVDPQTFVGAAPLGTEIQIPVTTPTNQDNSGPWTQTLPSDVTGITGASAAAATALFSFGPLLASTKYAINCDGTTTQATAGAGIGLSMQGSVNAPTKLQMVGSVNTAASTTSVQGAQVGSTTATAYYTGASGTLTTELPWFAQGTLLVGAHPTTLVLGMFTANASDAVTAKIGTSCTVAPVFN